MPEQANGSQKKTKRNRIIISAVTLVALIAALTVGMLYIWNSVIQPQPAVQAPLTLEAVGDTLFAEVNNATHSSRLITTSTDPFSVVYKYDDRVWVGLDQTEPTQIMAFSTNRDTAESSAADYDKIADVLLENAVAEVATVSTEQKAYSASEKSVRYFASDTLACVMSTDHLVDGDATTHAVNVRCAEKTAFEKTWQTVRLYAEAYISNGDNKSKEIVFSASIETNTGATEGYSYARIAVRPLTKLDSPHIVEYYKTPASDQWRWFALSDNRDTIPCARYASDELINTYRGLTCWDESTKSSSFVKQEAPTFEIDSGALGG